MFASKSPRLGESETRERVLDTVDGVSELCFGLFMPLSFVGTVSATASGGDAGRKMLFTAVGCNLAWGLADAVMYLIQTLTNCGRRLSPALAVRNEPDPAAGVRSLRDALPKALRPLVTDAELEPICRRLAEAAGLPDRPRFVREDS
jgi:hypothetical protein